MKKNFRFSYSAFSTYDQCSEKYRLRYIEKIYSKTKSSALFFGSSVDEALNVLLLSLKKNKTQEEIELCKITAEDVFLKEMSKYKDDIDCDYFGSDFEVELLTLNNFIEINENEPLLDANNITDFHNKCMDIVKKGGNLSQQDKLVINLMSWMCLVNKGLMMVESYRNEVIPLINEVFTIQKEVSLTNDSNDEIVGKIDFTCDFKDNPGVLYVCDNKTSSKAYKEDSVQLSEQLSIYCESENTDKACYVVVEKKVRKKDPKIRINIIKDVIPESTFESCFTKIEDYAEKILKEHFYLKNNKKDCYFFGKKCEYYLYCWSNGAIMTNLYKKEDV